MADATRQSSVNFGSHSTGLSTVGYTLYNFDGTIKQSRSTDNVIEVGSSGIYVTTFSADTGWNGIILWDDGQSPTQYAQDEKFSQLNKIQDQSDYIRIIFNTIKNRADYEGQVLRKLEKIIDSNKENSVESIKQIAKVIEKRDGLFNGIIDNDKNISNLIFSVKEDFNSLKKIIKSINENEKLRPKIDSPTIKKIVNESKRDSLNKIIQSINNSEKSRPKLNSDIIRKIVNDSRKESIKERRSILNAIKNLEFKLKILEKEIKNIKVNTGQEYDDAFVERELLPFKILAGVK